MATCPQKSSRYSLEICVKIILCLHLHCGFDPGQRQRVFKTRTEFWVEEVVGKLCHHWARCVVRWTAMELSRCGQNQTMRKKKTEKSMPYVCFQCSNGCWSVVVTSRSFEPLSSNFRDDPSSSSREIWADDSCSCRTSSALLIGWTSTWLTSAPNIAFSRVTLKIQFSESKKQLTGIQCIKSLLQMKRLESLANTDSWTIRCRTAWCICWTTASWRPRRVWRTWCLWLQCHSSRWPPARFTPRLKVRNVTLPILDSTRCVCSSSCKCYQTSSTLTSQKASNHCAKRKWSVCSWRTHWWWRWTNRFSSRHRRSSKFSLVSASTSETFSYMYMCVPTCIYTY